MAVPTKEMMAQLMPDVLARIDDLNYEPDGRTPRLSVDASAMAREYARQRYRREQAPFREPVRPFEREPPPITEALDASREKDVPFTLVDEAQWASMTRVERDRLVQQATQRYRRPQQMPYAAALATAGECKRSGGRHRVSAMVWRLPARSNAPCWRITARV